MKTMERRGFLKLALGVAAAAGVAGATSRTEALPVAAAVQPQSPATAEATPEPAVATPQDVEGAHVEKVWWRRRWWWRRRCWGWRRC